MVVAAGSLEISDDKISQSCDGYREWFCMKRNGRSRTRRAFARKMSVSARICAGPNAGF